MYKYIIQTIRKRMMRTLFTILAIAVCIGMYSVISSIITFTIKDLEGELAKYVGQLYVRDVGNIESADTFPPTDSTIDADILDKVKNLTQDNINEARSTAVLFRIIGNAVYPNGAPQAMIVGVEVGKEEAYLMDVAVKEGELSLDENSRNVVLGSSAVSFYDIDSVGDTIQINNMEFTVSGILEADGRVADSIVLMNIKDAQECLSLKSTYSAILLTAKTLDDVNLIKKSIDVEFTDVIAINQTDMSANMNDSLSGTKLFLGLIMYTVLAVAIIVILIVMSMAIMERTKEIGIIRALGANRKDIFKAIIGETLLLTTFGGIIGIVFGYCIMAYLMEARDFFTINIALTSLIMALSTGCISGIIPVIRACKINPQEAIRYE